MRHNDGRLKRVIVPYQVVMNLLMRQTTEIQEVIHFAGMPADIEVLDVHDLWTHRAFGFTLHHPSFDVVLEGAEIPVELLRYEAVRVERSPSQAPRGGYF